MEFSSHGRKFRRTSNIGGNKSEGCIFHYFQPLQTSASVSIARAFGVSFSMYPSSSKSMSLTRDLPEIFETERNPELHSSNIFCHLHNYS